MRNKTKLSNLSLLFNTLLEVLAMAIGQEKSMTHTDWKEVKLSVFVEDMILSLGNLKKSPHQKKGKKDN